MYGKYYNVNLYENVKWLKTLKDIVKLQAEILEGSKLSVLLL